MRKTRRERDQKSAFSQYVGLRVDTVNRSTREERPCPATRLLPMSRVSWSARVPRKRQRSSVASYWRTLGSTTPSFTLPFGERIPLQPCRLCHRPCAKASWTSSLPSNAAPATPKKPSVDVSRRSSWFLDRQLAMMAVLPWFQGKLAGESSSCP